MKSRASSLVACMLAAAFSLGGSVVLPGAAAALLPRITCAVIDSARSVLVPARCRVIDGNGYNRYPQLYTSFYHTSNGGYFYTDGIFAVAVPPGRVIIRSGRGFEYRERIDTLYVTGDTVIVAPLAREYSMAEEGWFSGDTHVHINHAGGHYTLTPEDAALMGRAEGLDVVNCLDNDYFFTGEPASCSTSDFVVFMSEEIRSGSWGHWGALGMRSLVRPTSSIWWPLAMDQLDSCRAGREGLVVSAHPVTTGDFDEVGVIEVLVKVGDTVKVEQSLITVESDKASMEIPSSAAGVVTELKVKLGDKVSKGSGRSEERRVGKECRSRWSPYH